MGGRDVAMSAFKSMSGPSVARDDTLFAGCRRWESCVSKHSLASLFDYRQASRIESRSPCRNGSIPSKTVLLAGTPLPRVQSSRINQVTSENGLFGTSRARRVSKLSSCQNSTFSYYCMPVWYVIHEVIDLCSVARQQGYPVDGGIHAYNCIQTFFVKYLVFARHQRRFDHARSYK